MTKICYSYRVTHNGSLKVFEQEHTVIKDLLKRPMDLIFVQYLLKIVHENAQTIYRQWFEVFA